MANMDFTFQNETQGLRAVTGELGGLERVLTRVSGKIGALLAGGKIADYLYSAAKATGALDEELHSLGNALKNLRSALGEGLAPLLQQVLPVIRWVIEKVTLAARYFGLLTQAGLGTADGSQAAAAGQEKLATASQKAAKAAQLKKFGK